MTNMMERFLNSLKIKNLERYDLDFDAAFVDKNDKRTVHMSIVKDTPWDYELLEEFLNGLNNINYPYTLSFSYRKVATTEQVKALFSDWHMSIYHLPSMEEIKTDETSLTFVFDNEEDLNNRKSMINDFKDFLKFIHYEFIVAAVVEVKEEAPIISDEKLAKMDKKVEKQAKKEIQIEAQEKETVDLRNSADDALKEHKEDLAIVEGKLLSEMEKNYKAMLEERKKFRPFERGNYVPHEHIADLNKEIDENVDIDGELYSAEIKPGRNKQIRLFGGIANNCEAVSFMAVEDQQSLTSDVLNSLKVGMRIRLRGYAKYDEKAQEVIVRAHYIDVLPNKPLRKDECEQKRVELHLHTNMSTQDGVAKIDEYCALAKSMGHKAIAITDHGVVQDFPYAQAAGKKEGIKILYGSELYMVDDVLNYINNPSDVILSTATYVVLDLETTGLSAKYCKIMEFGATKIHCGLTIAEYDAFINPTVPIPQKVQELTHITEDKVKGKPTFKEAWPAIKQFIGDGVIVTHNTAFDISFLNHELELIGEPPISNPIIDTLSLSRYMFPEAHKHTLGALSRNLDITTYNDEDAHNADYDARILADVWIVMLSRLTKNNTKLTHKELGELTSSKEMLKHLRSNHTCVLVKNAVGLKDLFKLISKSHIDYLADVPKVPRRELNAIRENLLIGSACFNGEVFDAARFKTKEQLKKVIRYYDYIEIQPKANYSYLLNRGILEDDAELERIIKDIVEAATEEGKLIVATGDVHYANPEDKIFRDVYISSRGVGKHFHPLYLGDRHDTIDLSIKVPESPDQHYRSTQEMLDAFAYLGQDKAFEYVVTNTNKIADMIEVVNPIKDKLYTPSIPNSDVDLRKFTYDRAHALYGEKLPEFIEQRLERELHGIIDNGYAVNYILARNIIKEANAHGNFVGSRGSVGSSLVATMAEITEVNPLPPHYRCPKCKHFEFANNPDIHSGIDLPVKRCPDCGEIMVKDGQNIPFETFLGFNAEKVPDIDLNFSSDYQAEAHDSLKRMLGEDHVFRAGTIETVANKTAFGYARGYFERMRNTKPDDVPKALLSYLAAKCTTAEVKRTTGQHPGGIIVIPNEFDVYDFTPIQYPADNKDATWKTTHFEFSTIHDTVLKLDLLGHVDPLALRMMGEISKVDIFSIPLDDAKVLSLFTSPKELKLSKNYLNVSTGAMGLPEFGTEFVQGVLKVAKPKTFNDLLIVSGITHGTDVWADNAEALLVKGVVKSLNDVIGCRDDIMTSLIAKGVPNNVAFKVMEDVRKGRKVKKEYEADLRNHGVPSYFIESCNKIKYLFPRAHATAYVTQAVRVGYFKIYYPLVFYAVFFSVRCDEYDIFTMIKGESEIMNQLEVLRRKKASFEKLTPKEAGLLSTFSMAIEMVERGYSFSKIDLYKSEASNFVIDEEHKCLIAPFTVLPGLGETAAQSVVEARQNGEFTSKEDLAHRTKLNETNIKDLDALGSLEGLSDSDQMSLFDFSF